MQASSVQIGRKELQFLRTVILGLVAVVFAQWLAMGWFAGKLALVADMRDAYHALADEHFAKANRLSEKLNACDGTDKELQRSPYVNRVKKDT